MASTRAVGVEDGGVADVPEAMFAGSGGKFAFEKMVADGMAGGDLFEEFSEAFERRDLGDEAADDLLFGKAEGLGLTIVDAEVAEFDGIEEGEADGSGLVDGLEFCALALGLFLAPLEGLGEGLAVVDVDGDAEPVEDLAGFVSDRLGPNPPPAGTAIASADHAGFDVVVDTSGDGAGPGLEDTFAVVRMEGVQPALAARVFDGEAEVVEEALIGIGDVAVGGAHPDGLRVEISEDAITGFAGDERFLVFLAAVMSMVRPRRRVETPSTMTAWPRLSSQSILPSAART